MTQPSYPFLFSGDIIMPIDTWKVMLETKKARCVKRSQDAFSGELGHHMNRQSTEEACVPVQSIFPAMLQAAARKCLDTYENEAKGVDQSTYEQGQLQVKKWLDDTIHNCTQQNTDNVLMSVEAIFKELKDNAVHSLKADSKNISPSLVAATLQDTLHSFDNHTKKFEVQEDAKCKALRAQLATDVQEQLQTLLLLSEHEEKEAALARTEVAMAKMDRLYSTLTEDIKTGPVSLAHVLQRLETDIIKPSLDEAASFQNVPLFLSFSLS
jgi:hypothetical protein